MKNKLTRIIAASLLLLSLVVGAFAGMTVQAEGEKKEVLTTFYPVYYLAQEIGGDAVNVSMLLEDNQDAHDYETSAQDAVKVQDADLFIYQDDEMEHFVSQLLTLVDGDKTQVLQSTEGIELLAGDDDHHHDHDHDHDHEEDDHHHDDHDHDHDHSHEFDPHTWMSPLVYAKQAENVRDALIAVDPDNESVYQDNAEDLIKRLHDLDQEYHEALDQEEDRTLVVQHAAFGYLAHEYNLEQVAITGLSSIQEPSAAKLAEMQEFVKEHKTSVIYVDPSMDESIAETVASASGAELRPLRTLEILPQEDIDQGADYFTVMRDNLAELTK